MVWLTLRRARGAATSTPAVFVTVEVMQFPELVEARADVMLGKPCLKGTRIPVYLILEKLAAGETGELILTAYPQLRPEHIRASLEYAARLAADEIVLANQ
jgi:uncharacterized protein (DUF433 family)